MKSIYLFIVLAVSSFTATVAQEAFDVFIEPIAISNAPSVQSFSWGKTADGKWVVLGGRIDGLHQRQPFAAFLPSSNNTSISVIDPENNQVWSASLSGLPTSIFEQLQSTNQEFHQNGNSLYVIGGYGYSTTASDHITYGNLTAIDINGVANAVINNANINSFFRQLSDTNLSVTGGHLGFLNGTYYLCGGQYFEGRYNPMGPNNGPGFIQRYTNQIRKFEVIDNGTNLSIANYAAITDVNELHRRDYNMSPQIFPNGQQGFTMFSGVFNPNDLPYLNTVNVFDTGYAVNNNFNQYLSQYHSAKLPIHDNASNTMHTLFFGGMSQYTLDANGNLVQDNNVPFVKTISKVTRASNGSMTESKLDIEMPTLLGSGAEFIPESNANWFLNGEILNLNNLTADSTMVGYIYGGIESTAPNIFFINNGTQSSASNIVFKVYIVKSITGINEKSLSGENVFNMNVFPNPSSESVNLSFFIPSYGKYSFLVYNLSGQLILTKENTFQPGKQQIQLDLKNISPGEYFITISGNTFTSQQKLIIY